MDKIKEAFSPLTKKYADFNGCATRKEFWSWILICVIIDIIFSLLGTFGMILRIIWGLGVLVPSLAVTVRRLRDAGRDPWCVLLPLIPIVGVIILLIFCAQASKADAPAAAE